MKNARLNLILWEKKNNLKGKDVAEKLGISETTYSLIKNGKTTPSLELAYKFKKIFGVNDVLELLRKEEENEKHNSKENRGVWL